MIKFAVSIGGKVFLDTAVSLRRRTRVNVLNFIGFFFFSFLRSQCELHMTSVSDVANLLRAQSKSPLRIRSSVWESCGFLGKWRRGRNSGNVKVEREQKGRRILEPPSFLK